MLRGSATVGGAAVRRRSFPKRVSDVSYAAADAMSRQWFLCYIRPATREPFSAVDVGALNGAAANSQAAQMTG